jgi:branched-chain amino acid transport system substrate-binding protein
MLLRLLACFTCTLSLSGAYAADTLIIGQSAPLSGNNAAFGKDIRNGALAYFTLVNESGGVGGKRIELLTLDDRNDRKVAGENAAKLIEGRQAVALFGFASATLSLDALPLAERSNLPVFATFTGANSVRKSPVTFTLRPTYEEEMVKILAFWQSKGFQRITVVHYDDEIGLQNFKSVAEQVKLRSDQPVAAVSMKRNLPTDNATVEAVIASNPDLVINTVASGQAVKLVQELRGRGKHYFVSSTSFVGSSQFASAIGAVGAGVSITQVVPAPTSVTIPVVVECRKAMSRLKLDLNYTSLESCIGAKVLVEGLRRAGRDASGASLLRALQSLGTYDVGGFSVNFSRGNRHGSNWSELSVLSKSGEFRI